MRKKRKPSIRAGMACLLALGLATGCGALRSEFFRGETAHLLGEGNRLYRSGAFKEAASCYERAVALDPACARGHAALGHVAYVGGRFREALCCYDRAVDLDPGLEATLAPLILDARRMEERKHLGAAGADPQRVFALLTAEGEAEVEILLQKDVSPAVLARHATSLPAKDRTGSSSSQRKGPARAESLPGAPCSTATSWPWTSAMDSWQPGFSSPPHPV